MSHRANGEIKKNSDENNAGGRYRADSNNTDQTERRQHHFAVLVFRLNATLLPKFYTKKNVSLH